MAKKAPPKKPRTKKAPAGKARAFGRSLADFGELNSAEQEVLDAAREGRWPNFSSSIPKTDDEKKARTIRAGFVRFLALGGDDANPVHELGVRVSGVVIEGSLDFRGCSIAGDFQLLNSVLAGALILVGARVRSIILNGSTCNEIIGDRVKIADGLFMRNDFVALGTVRLVGAKVGGNLDCGRARFEQALVCAGAQIGGYIYMNNGFVARGAVNFRGASIAGDLACTDCRFEGYDDEGDALSCGGMQVGGAVFLRSGFYAQGSVNLINSKIGGVFDCGGGQFESQKENREALQCDGLHASEVFFGDGFVSRGAVNLVAAVIGGDVVFAGGRFGAAAIEKETGEKDIDLKISNPPTRMPALILARATIKGTLWLGVTGDKAKFHGGVDLTGATIGRVADVVKVKTDRRSPDSSAVGAGDCPAFLMLDGLNYTRFTEYTDLSAKARIAFLRLQSGNDLGFEFKPHPWTQMIKVLREAGHTEAARDVAIEFENARRKAGAIKSKTARCLHWIYGNAVGYGHRPMRLLKITVAVWLGCALLYYDASLKGWIAPTNPIYFQDSRYEKCRPENGGNWVFCDMFAASEYTTFHALAYSLDLILPLVDLEQEKSWSLIVDKGFSNAKEINPDFNWGRFVRIVMWFEILFGWAASLLFVSVAASFVKRMDGE